MPPEKKKGLPRTVETKKKAMNEGRRVDITMG